MLVLPTLFSRDGTSGRGSIMTSHNYFVSTFYFNPPQIVTICIQQSQPPKKTKPHPSRLRNYTTSILLRSIIRKREERGKTRVHFVKKLFERVT